MAGWGKTDSEIYFHGQTLKYPSKLRQVDVPIQNTRQCGKNYKQSGTFDSKSFQISKSFVKLRINRFFFRLVHTRSQVNNKSQLFWIKGVHLVANGHTLAGFAVGAVRSATKVIGGATTQKNLKTNTKTLIFSI